MRPGLLRDAPHQQLTAYAARFEYALVARECASASAFRHPEKRLRLIHTERILRRVAKMLGAEACEA